MPDLIINNKEQQIKLNKQNKPPKSEQEETGLHWETDSYGLSEEFSILAGSW